MNLQSVRRILRATFAVLCLVSLNPPIGWAQESANGQNKQFSASVEQPSRAFGHVVGDILKQRINLTSSAGTIKLVEPLPLGRIGLWLERQSANEITDHENNTWLEISYQIINAPVSVINDALPSLTLTGQSGNVMQVPASPYSLGPITTENIDPLAGSPLMQPDREPAINDTRNASRLLRVSGVMLFLTALAWLGWWFWRQQRDRVRLPFAAAWHTIQKTDSTDTSNHRDAWIALHSALNRYSGKTVQPSSLQELIDEHPWLSPLQSRLESFFKASAGHFFEHPARSDSFPLFELSRDLYLEEKRQSG